MDLPPKSPSFARSPSSLSHAASAHDQEGSSNGANRISLSKDRRASASTLPLTPNSKTASPTPYSTRRPSFSFALRQSASSPRLSKRSSRSSLHGQSPQQMPDGNEQRPTPKKSISTLISGLREAQAQSSMASIAEPVQLTGPDIAKVHFARELARMESAEAETLVVLHDACYGHRFSRPRTSKSSLSMIVERPERLHAGVLGAATAFVRLGGHHEGQANAPSADMETAVGGSPPFKIRRTARTLDVGSSYVTNVHGTAWMKELQGMCDAAGGRLARGEKELARDSTTEDGEKRTLHEGDLYLCTESLNAFQGALGGVADAVDAIFSPELRTKRAFVAVRPPGHHCSADYPSGFCWLNNVHVGLEYAAQTHGLTHAAIVDFDLHHGDGSQSITWDRNSKNNIKRLNAKNNSKLKLGPDIGYYSLHDINSYPCESGDDEKVQAASLCIENAHGQSIWNVHLQPWKTEDEFWQLYESRYKVLLEKARAFLTTHTSRLRMEGKTQPKAAIFISAGFDASEWEGAGMQRHKVNVPTEFYARFTRDMVKLAQEDDTGCDGRVVSVLEGGYSDRALCSGVLSHLSGLSSPSAPAPAAEPVNAALDLEQYMSGLSLQNNGQNSASTYDPQWWSEENLTALETKVNPPPPPAAAKKYRVGQQPTYATPTESFAYKVHDPERFARSVSGTMRESPLGPVRPSTPPVPEVDWVLATQELASLLIPQDRQTKSCRPEELAPPKKVTVAPSAAQKVEAERPRQLRTRAKPNYRENADELSRAERRRTTSDLPLATEPAPEPIAAPSQAKRSSRRSSMASTSSSRPTEPEEIPPVPVIVPVTNGAMQPPPIPAAGPAAAPPKRTRAPPKLRKPAGTASAPVSPMATFKAQPAPLSGTAAPPVNDDAQSPTTANPAPAPAIKSPTSDMDALTQGLKKVTLKIGTREEHDRKMKEKVDAERRARAMKGAETRRLNKAARDAKAAEAKITPAQRAKIGPATASSEGVKSADVDVEMGDSGLPPSMSIPPNTQQAVAIDPPAPQSTAPAEPYTQSGLAVTQAPEVPRFTIPSYQEPSSAPLPAMAPAINIPPPQTASTEQRSPQLSPPLSQHSRQSSYSSLYRFVPVIDTTPPTSRPSTSFRAQSYPQAPPTVSETTQAEKPILPERAASARLDTERQLPVFSATGPIPFAGSGVEMKPTLETSAPEMAQSTTAGNGYGGDGQQASLDSVAGADAWAVPQWPGE
ncbi:hypothetical protein Q7P37_005654 [Cladosporium fusiforme]